MKTVTLKLTIDQWEDKTTLEALDDLDRWYELELAKNLRMRIDNLVNLDTDELPDAIDELDLDATALMDTLDESQGIFENSQIYEIVTEVFEQARSQ